MINNNNELSEKFKSYCDEEHCFNFFDDFSFEDIIKLNHFLNLFYCFYSEEDFEVLGDFYIKLFDDFYDFLDTMSLHSIGIDKVIYPRFEVSSEV